MFLIDQNYIDGRFVEVHGEELSDLHNPATGQVIGRVRLGDDVDIDLAVAAAKRALPAFSATSRAERVALLRKLNEAMRGGIDQLAEATVLEYGAPAPRARWMAEYAADAFLVVADLLESYPLERPMGTAMVRMEAVGVAGLITPWNANAASICGKVAYALAAGCTVVVKPSEISALQTSVVIERLHAAGLPDGVVNIVNGRGAVAGAALVAHPDVAKVSFTGSVAVGKSIVRSSAETLKRVTLELGGKSPTIILDDADLHAAVDQTLAAGFQNSGQACIAGTRILVSEARVAAFEELLKSAVAKVKVGDPRDPATAIGPMASQAQFDRVQRYIRAGVVGGARLLVGGEGHPDGLDGYFVRPTVFTGVTNDMTVAREEIFGPVLAVITYRSEDEAVTIANDTTYGLSAYVLSDDQAHAEQVAARLQSGRVVINGAPHEVLAPFGGVKQSGLGRENGIYGLEAYLEPKTVLGGRHSFVSSGR